MRTAVLAVSFGTTHLDALRADIVPVEEALADAFPGCPVYRAFTSGVVRRRLRERQNMHVDSVEEALARIRSDGMGRVVVQPTLLLPGEEYDGLCAALTAADGLEVRAGRPLLYGEDDLDGVIAALRQAYPVGEDTALLLMGHGTAHAANALYEAMARRLRRCRGRRCACARWRASPPLKTRRRSWPRWGGPVPCWSRCCWRPGITPKTTWRARRPEASGRGWRRPASGPPAFWAGWAVWTASGRCMCAGPSRPPEAWIERETDPFKRNGGGRADAAEPAAPAAGGHQQRLRKDHPGLRGASGAGGPGIDTGSFKCGRTTSTPCFTAASSARPAPIWTPSSLRKIPCASCWPGMPPAGRSASSRGSWGTTTAWGLPPPGASTYEVARWTQTPVVLVVGAKGTALSALAVLQGFLDFCPDHPVQGVLLNQCSEGAYPALAGGHPGAVRRAGAPPGVFARAAGVCPL